MHKRCVRWGWLFDGDTTAESTTWTAPTPPACVVASPSEGSLDQTCHECPAGSLSFVRDKRHAPRAVCRPVMSAAVATEPQQTRAASRSQLSRIQPLLISSGPADARRRSVLDAQRMHGCVGSPTTTVGYLPRPSVPWCPTRVPPNVATKCQCFEVALRVLCARERRVASHGGGGGRRFAVQGVQKSSRGSF